jgi:prophage tail gpP-like protein
VPDDLALLVNGKRYAGWTSISVTRSIESFAGSFALTVSERWADQEQPWPIREEDACRVELDGQILIDGYVDRRRPVLGAREKSLEVSGRDKAAALVDCSAVLSSWSFKRKNIRDIARILGEPFGVTVSVAPGVTIPEPIKKVAVSPGEKAYEVIARVAAASGVLVVSDAAGGLVITQSGTTRAEAIVEGVNLLAGSPEVTADERFYRYIVASQSPGSDDTFGDSTRIRAEAIDEGVRRTDRVLLIREQQGISTAYARRRADWYARVRAGQSTAVSISVAGWRQSNGDLWPVNALVAVKSPWLALDGDLLIAQTTFAIANGGGEVTTMQLVRPDAFAPEPQSRVKLAGGRYDTSGGL